MSSNKISPNYSALRLADTKPGDLVLIEKEPEKLVPCYVIEDKYDDEGISFMELVPDWKTFLISTYPQTVVLKVADEWRFRLAAPVPKDKANHPLNAAKSKISMSREGRFFCLN